MTMTAATRVRCLSSLAAAAAVLLLGACAGQRAAAPSPAVPLSEVIADVRIVSARAFDRSVWLPDSVGFSRSPRPARRGGQLVLFEGRVLWGFVDPGSGSFRVLRDLPIRRIRTLHLARKGGEALLVIEGDDGRFDSFGIESLPNARGQAPRFDPDAIGEAWRELTRQAGLASPAAPPAAPPTPAQ